jgi:fido (protein-threonine AMPylation protein)
MPEITYSLAEKANIKQRYENWLTAIGLQSVDNLRPSKYLTALADKHIEGEKSIDEIERLIHEYYSDGEGRNAAKEERQDEADIVSVRIAKLLETKTFTLTENSLKAIHKKLFANFKEYTPGKYRRHDIIKKEWVLDNDTVQYGHWDMLEDEIALLINKEQHFDYSSRSTKEQVQHIADFVSEVWVQHAFLEGNTRTTAVFAIKHLRSIGFEINNEPFEEHSRYFRNALARANYRNGVRMIEKNNKFLLRFFQNLLLHGNHELKNREIHIFWHDDMKEVKPCVFRYDVEDDGGNARIGERISERISPYYYRITTELSKTERKNSEMIKQYVNEHKYIDSATAASVIGKSQETAKKLLSKMAKCEMLVAIGSTKNRHYRVPE